MERTLEMVKAKVIRLAAFALVLCSLNSCAYRWRAIKVDNKRSGCVSVTANNSDVALGHIDDDVYYAPSGKRSTDGSALKVAKILLDVQDDVKELKQVVAYAPTAVKSYAPQSELSNFTVDCVMRRVGAETGRKVDVGLTNFGGIRRDVPRGDVILDDFVSMFPFTNYLVYVRISGAQLRDLVQGMVNRGKLQVLGGVELVIDRKAKKIESFKVGGEPLDDDRVYGLASIDFLLKGGDDIDLEKRSVEVEKTGVLIRTAVLDEVHALTAAGKPFEYHLDNRVVVNE